MKADQMIEVLEAAAAQVGVEVRYESLTASGAGGSGGLCKVRGAWWVIIDKKAAPNERAAMLVDALCGFDTSAVELPPKVREALETRRLTRQGAA
jgi:hypothetical protein